MRITGTLARGIRAPLVKAGDNPASWAVQGIKERLLF